MSIYDLQWTPTEKKIARKAFDQAYEREMKEIKEELLNRINNLKSDNEIWSVEEFLRFRKREMSERYDYRYSILMITFITLINKGFLTIEDLNGLSQDKIEKIQNVLDPGLKKNLK